MTVKCIDISHWQGSPDFGRVADDGTLVVIHKATEGTSYVDPNCASNCAAARKEGLATCCYFWLSPGSARSQVEHFLETVQPVDGERVVIDYEEEGCELHNLEDAVQALLDYGHNLQITVYSGHLLKDQLHNDYNELLAENTSLWLAQYTTGEPDWPKGTWNQWSLWQYTDQGSVGGISPCDCNRFNGTDDQLLAWIGPAKSEVAVPPKPPRPPVPRPKDQVVTVIINTPRDIRVDVITVYKPVRSRSDASDR